MLSKKNMSINDNTFRKLSIIIPAYNEQSTLAEIIQAVRNVDLSLTKEIIIVDDASTDETRQVIEQLPGDNLVKVYH
ncbi:MAG: glycosyltransferase, partial [Candidatus Electrothrix sp. LOE1_4_5]|nr:glycosyltransferase [Candidatus Electrothrix gigas]